MGRKRRIHDTCNVALLAEGVDRNTNMLGSAEAAQQVALLAEGVDRNGTGYERTSKYTVALLAEGVDRNSRIVRMSALLSGRPPRGGRGLKYVGNAALVTGVASPSSRRAWIEIFANV